MSEPREAPVRLCCYQRHFGPQCPDGKVMCCLCFYRFEVAELAIEGGTPVDVCKPCWDYDQAAAAARRAAEDSVRSDP